MSHENAYLQNLVGDALARGCAATVTCQPNDSVEFLALWLLRYVKNAEIEGEFYRSKQEEIDAKKAALEAALEASHQVVARERAKASDLEALADMEGEPRQLLQAAVDVIKRHTSVGAVYAANVADPEQPDWTPPEDLEDPNYETEDEADAPPAEGEGAEGEAEAPPEEPEEPVEDSGEAAAPPPKRKTDYSKKYFSYVAASEGQEFITKVDLRRPPPPAEDAGDDEAAAPPMPTTFRILDDRQPLLYVPNVAMDPAVRFFRDLPKIGAYIAAAVRVTPQDVPAGFLDEPVFCSVLAGDSLFPEGHGQELDKEEQDFVWEVSIALGKAMDRILQSAKALIAADAALGPQLLADLKSTTADLSAQHKEAAAQIEEPPAPEEVDPDAEPSAVAEEEGEDGEGAPPDEAVEKAVAKVEALKVSLTYSRWKEALAAARLEEAKAVHAAVVEALMSIQERAVFAVQHRMAVPQGTFLVLRALLLLLGETAADVSSWKQVQTKVTGELFEKAAAFDALAPRDMAVWKLVCAAYRGVTNSKALETEFASTCLGAVVLRYIKEVRKVANRAAGHRASVEAVSDQEQQLVAAEAAVVAAEEAKAAAEARAEEERLAAEAAEAAAAAAEAAGEGEEGEGEGEGDE